MLMHATLNYYNAQILNELKCQTTTRGISRKWPFEWLPTHDY